MVPLRKRKGQYLGVNGLNHKSTQSRRGKLGSLKGVAIGIHRGSNSLVICTF